MCKANHGNAETAVALQAIMRAKHVDAMRTAMAVAAVILTALVRVSREAKNAAPGAGPITLRPLTVMRSNKVVAVKKPAPKKAVVRA